jgi:predicted transcriptional regulator
LEQHAWQIENIGLGIAAADRGELVNHDIVMKEIEESIESKVQVKM